MSVCVWVFVCVYVCVWIVTLSWSFSKIAKCAKFWRMRKYKFAIFWHFCAVAVFFAGLHMIPILLILLISFHTKKGLRTMISNTNWIYIFLAKNEPLQISATEKGKVWCESVENQNTLSHMRKLEALDALCAKILQKWFA